MILVIEGPEPAACHELVALEASAVADCDAVLAAAGGRSLPCAPGRWLLPGWGAAELGELGLRTAGQGILFDAGGKYCALRLRGPGASRVLHRAADIDAILACRSCAAVTLFDCPAVIARAADGFEVWVHASYGARLAAALRG